MDRNVPEAINPPLPVRRRTTLAFDLPPDSRPRSSMDTDENGHGDGHGDQDVDASRTGIVNGNAGGSGVKDADLVDGVRAMMIEPNSSGTGSRPGSGSHSGSTVTPTGERDEGATQRSVTNREAGAKSINSTLINGVTSQSDSFNVPSTSSGFGSASISGSGSGSARISSGFSTSIGNTKTTSRTSMGPPGLTRGTSFTVPTPPAARKLSLQDDSDVAEAALRLSTTTNTSTATNGTNGSTSTAAANRRPQLSNRSTMGQDFLPALVTRKSDFHNPYPSSAAATAAGNRGVRLSTDSEVDSADPDANFFRLENMRYGESGGESADEEFGIGGAAGINGGGSGGPSPGLWRNNSNSYRSRRPPARVGMGTTTTGTGTGAGVTTTAVDGSLLSPGNHVGNSATSTATITGTGSTSVSNLGSKGVGVRKGAILDETAVPVITATSIDGRERLEWQSMLASVLGGEILKGEKSRIGGERPTSETYRKEVGEALWWQIRARLRGRSEEEEKRRVKARKERTVDAILEEVQHFRVDIPDHLKATGLTHEIRTPDGLSSHPTDRASELRDVEEEMSAEDYAIEKILTTLSKLSLAESLYPHEQAMRAEKPLYNSADIQAKIDAMSAWSTLVRMLHSSLVRLQKWTGSKELDVTQRNTTSEKPLVNPSSRRTSAVGDHAADDSTFIERILKEDSITNIFSKRAITDLYSAIYMARETVIEHSPMFIELGLSRFSRGFRNELVMLIAFPARLIIEALRVRLDAVTKLVDPSVYAIDDMIDNFRQTLHLACQIKERYLQIVEPNDEKHWKIPHCIGDEYDEVILDGLRTFFKLLHWKLKSGSKAIYFKETEVLEDEWEFLYTVAEAVEGGDIVVAEHFCSLTNKLMQRVINYFESQLHVPIRLDGADDVDGTMSRRRQKKKELEEAGLIGRRPGERRVMSTDEMLQWFAKILDAVKMRYRKLQRFARRLTQRFDNSAEYTFGGDDIEIIVEALDDTDHFLVYTQSYEAEGNYILADPSLRDRPELIQQILLKSFSPLPSVESRRTRNEIAEGAISSGEDGIEILEDFGSYLLVLSPRRRFVWPGAVLHLELPFIQLNLHDNRIRLIADGPVSRLAMCKETFAHSFIEPETQEPFVHLDCVVEQQAHLPRIQKELKRISRSTHRLSESIVESVSHVRNALRGAPGAEDLTENWFAFAADHGQRVGTHMDHSAWSRFSRLLMRLAINWVGFVCDQCDPTDRKTFRWAVNALEYAMTMTRGNNILHMEQAEFASLRSKVAACMALLISHFDILGARSSIEAKKEAEKLEAIRRLQRLQEFQDDDSAFDSKLATPGGEQDMETRIKRLTAEVYGSAATDRSIRLVRESRIRLITQLEQARLGLVHDQHLVGQVLDEEVSEDRSLLFLASSSSNIALRWQQGNFIGGGANGNVYIGFNLDSGGIMAVKEIRVQDLSNSPALYTQIKDESDVMQMLSHPNIVDYYGIEVHRDRVYIFEEYCEGGSLAQLLEHGRVEDEEIIMVYTIQMLQGLEYLHSKGVEHRDVKPDNILLGANSTIKFVDFGAAKVIIKGNRTIAKTRAFNHAGAGRIGAGGVDGVPAMNSLAGTPMYMAPEVIRNDRVGKLGAMDIWSMGCVVLEFATGKKPWSNLDNEWAIMFHIGISTKHPPLPEPGELSEAGIDFIELCLTLDPAQRPTAEELLRHPWLAATQQQLYDHNTVGTSSLQMMGEYQSLGNGDEGIYAQTGEEPQQGSYDESQYQQFQDPGETQLDQADMSNMVVPIEADHVDVAAYGNSEGMPMCADQLTAAASEGLGLLPDYGSADAATPPESRFSGHMYDQSGDHDNA